MNSLSTVGDYKGSGDTPKDIPTQEEQESYKKVQEFVMYLRLRNEAIQKENPNAAAICCIQEFIINRLKNYEYCKNNERID